MLKKIFALEKLLREVGAEKQANKLSKLAAPLIDAISTDGGRNPSIGKSYRQDWFDSIKLLKNNVVLFHFNKNSGELPSFTKKLSKVFSGSEELSYKQIKKKYSVLSEEAVKALSSQEPGESKNIPTTSMGAAFDSFKSEFPEAASKAEQALASQGLTKEDAIFFLYNEQELDPRETKTAPYFAHDIGHIVWDVFESQYMRIISKDIFKIFSFYTKKDDWRLTSDKEDVDLRNIERLSSKIFIPEATLGSKIADEFLKKSVSGIFSRGGENVADAAYDLVALCSNPNYNVQVSIPSEFDLPYPYNEETYIISPDKKAEAEAILTQSLNNLKKEISEKDFLPPEMKGKVFFMELF